MQSVIKIGSRESQLAVRQAEIIRDQIISCDPGITVEIITMKTTGDKILDKSLEKIGGKGLFVKELDRALMDGRIDIARAQPERYADGGKSGSPDPCLRQKGRSKRCDPVPSGA